MGSFHWIRTREEVAFNRAADSEPSEWDLTGQFATDRVPDPTAITKILKLADAVLTYGVLRFADYSGYQP